MPCAVLPLLRHLRSKQGMGLASFRLDVPTLIKIIKTIPKTGQPDVDSPSLRLFLSGPGLCRVDSRTNQHSQQPFSAHHRPGSLGRVWKAVFTQTWWESREKQRSIKSCIRVLLLSPLWLSKPWTRQPGVLPEKAKSWQERM